MKYSVRIIRGRGEGRRIGFPTLNFEVPPELKEPHGIYAGWVWLGGAKLPAAFHWGGIPSFDIPGVYLEAHVLDSDLGDIPEAAEIELVEFVRPVAKMTDVEKLKERIAEDVRIIRGILSG